MDPVSPVVGTVSASNQIVFIMLTLDQSVGNFVGSLMWPGVLFRLVGVGGLYPELCYCAVHVLCLGHASAPSFELKWKACTLPRGIVQAPYLCLGDCMGLRVDVRGSCVRHVPMVMSTTSPSWICTMVWVPFADCI